MSKKQFELLARIMWGQKVDGAPETSVNAAEYLRGANDQHHTIVEALCYALGQECPRFNAQRFRDACNAPLVRRQVNKS